MEHTVLETKDLTKRYGKRITAVDNLNLSVRRGEVYGFLGPNGAGKTTTLRMLLGLIVPTAGTATVLDGRPGTPEVLASMGALVESPAFYPYLSGWRTLRVMACYAGVLKQRIEAVLDQVDLTDRAGDIVGVASISSLKENLIPRWIPWLGIVAALSLLSLASLAWFPATYLILFGRLLCFIWVAAVSLLLVLGRQGEAGRGR